FTGSLVALPVLAASPPAVPLLPLTHRWRGGGRPPPVLVTIGMPIAPSIRLPLGWPPDGVLACHPYARRAGERDGRALTPPRVRSDGTHLLAPVDLVPRLQILDSLHRVGGRRQLAVIV